MSSTLISTATPPAELLAGYATSEGKLVAPTSASWQIVDLTNGGVIATNANVDLSSAQIETGAYKAIEAGGGLWTPASDYSRAAIEWTFAVNGKEKKMTRFFESVPADGIIQPSLGLCLIQDVKDAGSTETSSPKIWRAVQRWTSLVERVTRQRFRPVRETKRFRGQGATLMLLPEPLFGCSKIEVEDSEIASNLFHVYGATGRERSNPRIELLSEVRNIYRVRISSRFYESHKVAISGVWGYLDVDAQWEGAMTYLEPPREIIDATARGAYLSLYESTGAQVAIATGAIKKETTDGHSIEYAVTAPAASKASPLDILKDPEIADALDLYRAPIHVAAPAE